MSDLVGIGMMAFGTIFVFVGSVGVVRFQDVYLRLQAASKALTFGFCFLVLGAALNLDSTTAVMKALVAVSFQFMTAPLAAQMIARSALRRGHHPRLRSSLESEPAPGPDL
ncbi:monovalent cation/H(+) antiporter subunit G [bacterium]|nr:monovalent cation/H(+) antiporter subunit G [bacterium]